MPPLAYQFCVLSCILINRSKDTRVRAYLWQLATRCVAICVPQATRVALPNLVRLTFILTFLYPYGTNRTCYMLLQITSIIVKIILLYITPINHNFSFNTFTKTYKNCAFYTNSYQKLHEIFNFNIFLQKSTLQKIKITLKICISISIIFPPPGDYFSNYILTNYKAYFC